MAIRIAGLPTRACMATMRLQPKVATPKSSQFMGQRLSRSLLLPKSTLAARLLRSQAAVPVRAAFLGVGAPEALLVGVVALVLFGPKGLAQAAKTLGATLRSFAPTIRELTQVSTELKSSLEQEIGLNDFRDELQGRPAVPAPRPTRPAAEIAASSVDEAAGPASAESLEAITASMMRGDVEALAVDPEIERRRAESAKMAWGGQAPQAATAAAAAPAEGGGSLAGMSIEELERELERRKAQ